MKNYSLDFPDDFDLEEWIWETKGWITLTINYRNQKFELNFYDPVRLTQTMTDDLHSQQYFLEQNLIVIPNINRLNIEKVIQDLVNHDKLIEILKIKTGS
ncbi:hypothetical protein [Acinetobacter sp. NIPH 298]|uniref:hypothetical protein n=1 Tax=Acinetobacter sp. NIPH 298 TaxID=1217692 RepID=UPI0002CD85DF|nr:hypothetical protein [Acinetobacter sp. NIPH 298]ENW96435.1 hypothetical protein F903_02205 [Acinetobacter sp. NIPH 298]